MATWATIEEFYSFKKVTYYTIRLEGSTHTEMEKFILKFESDADYQAEFESLMALLIVLGNEKGGSLRFFRDEARVQALPPETRISISENWIQFIGANLRLFCLRIDDDIVILLDGGIKTSQKTADSPDLSSKFWQAQRICKSIDEQIKNRELRIFSKKLVGELEFSF